MAEHTYRGELVHFGHTGEIVTGGYEVQSLSLDDARIRITQQLTCSRSSLWLRILEDGVEVELREIPHRPDFPQVGSFG